MSVEVQRVAAAALFTCWQWQIEHGHLTRAGLLALRGRLDEGSNEFVAGDDVLTMRLLVADALGVDSADEQVPDFPPDPPHRDW